MIAILLFISFGIHVVLLAAIWKLMNQVKTMKDNQPEAILDIFETYLEEVKEENRQLLNRTTTHNRYPDDAEDQSSSAAPNEKSDNDTAPHTNTAHVPTSHPPKTNDEQSRAGDVTLSFEANVLHLHSQGLSVEEIAKKLNSGKTEVMLIVKFHKENKRN